jgi:hypothetical protein
MSEDVEALGLSQRAYTIARSLRKASNWLFILTVSILFFVSLSLVTIYYASLLQGEIYFYTAIGSIIVAVFVSSYIVCWFVIKGKHEYKRMNDWNEDYLNSSYTLIFATTIPKGNSTGERILNLDKLIFPELSAEFNAPLLDQPSEAAFVSGVVKRLAKRQEKTTQEQLIRRGLNYRVDGYLLDLALETRVGYFIVKDFGEDIVTEEHMKELIRVCSRFSHVFRIIGVARNYEEEFINRPKLEQLMDNLTSGYKVDLVVKEEKGYSVLWVG